MIIPSYLFLTQQELNDLTDLKVAKAQMRWLDKNSCPYVISAAGKPKVLRSYLIGRLHALTSINQSNEPNFDAIR